LALAYSGDLAPWCFLWLEGKAGDTDTPASIFWYLLRELFHDGMSLGRLEEFLGFIIFAIIIPLLFAAIIAWVIHCPIVMLIHRPKNDDASAEG